MDQLRIGVVGLGYMGGLHLRAWQGSGNARVTAVADSNPGALHRLPEGIAAYSDYRELLETDVDAVSICTPTSLHCRMTLDALAAGKHVLLEKPIAPSMAQARSMMSAAQNARRVLFVGMTHRFYPEVREAKHLVESGTIGELVFIRDVILEHAGFLDSPSWYLDPEMAGGGTVLSSGIHLVDRVLWFAGEPVIEVSGCASNAFFGSRVEDAAQMWLRFDSGRCAQISFGFMREAHPLVCDLHLVGTRGSLVVHTWQGYELHTARGSQVREIYINEAHWEKVLAGLQAEVREFCDAVRTGRAPQPSVEESTRALEVVEKFYRAVSVMYPVGL